MSFSVFGKFLPVLGQCYNWKFINSNLQTACEREGRDTARIIWKKEAEKHILHSYYSHFSNVHLKKILLEYVGPLMMLNGIQVILKLAKEKPHT